MGRQFQVGDRVRDERARGIVTAMRPTGFMSHNKGLTFVDAMGGKYWAFIDDCEWIDHSGIARALGRGYGG